MPSVTVRTAVRSAALLVAAGLATTLAVVASPSVAGAASRTCTARATLPSRVALTSGETTIRPKLVGDAGCRADTADAGAVAYLYAPGEQPYELRWDKFGTREKVLLVRGLDRPGRYRIAGGRASVYDEKYERVASRWTDTVMTVRYGSRFAKVGKRHGTVHATLTRYGANGWTRSGHTAVALQKHTGSGWHTVARTHSSKAGKVSVRHSTRGTYRLVSAATSRVAKATRRV